MWLFAGGLGFFAGVAVQRSPILRLWDALKGQPSDEMAVEDKMVPMEMFGTFGPLGLVIAGLDTAQTDVLRQICAKVVPSRPAPIMMLSTSDGDERLQDVLPHLRARDKVEPSEALHTAHPFILFSGLTAEQVREAVALIAEAPIPTPMMAMAVPRAMPKPVAQLVAEIQGDFEAQLDDIDPELLG